MNDKIEGTAASGACYLQCNHAPLCGDGLRVVWAKCCGKVVSRAFERILCRRLLAWLNLRATCTLRNLPFLSFLQTDINLNPFALLPKVQYSS